MDITLRFSWMLRLGGGLIAAALALGSLGFAHAAAPAADTTTPSPSPSPTPVGPYFLPMIFSYIPPGQSSVMTVKQQAFDTCTLPSLTALQTWWKSSPYRTMGLYLGGSSFPDPIYCNYSGLSSAYLAAADSMGWTFILVWVGPQAPCLASRYPEDLTSISTDLTNAFNQGRAEADSAVARAVQLGFGRNILIYYDLEGYATYQTDACRKSVNSFMSGWVNRLHQLNYPAGAYGSPLGSHIADWATISDVPNYVWIACWGLQSYSSSVSTSCSSYFSDGLWSSHQRIRQYTGGHTETWGSKAINIDSDVIDGAVADYSSGGPATSAAAPMLIIPETAGSEVERAQLVGPGQGWALVNHRLTWLDGASSGRRDITPESLAGGLIDVAFTDGQRGWAAGFNADGILSLAATQNHGATWQLVSLPEAAGLPPLSAAWLNFADSQHGWLSVRFQSSAAFSLGTAFRTQDGGRNWQSLAIPAAGRVWFADDAHGWLAGGASGGELFATVDGGMDWNRVSIPGLSARPDERLFYGMPADAGDGRLLLPVTRSSVGSTSLMLFVSQDQGASWAQAPAGELSVPAEGAGPIALVPAGQRRLAAGIPDGSLVFFDTLGNLTGRLAAGALPGGWSDLRFAGPDTAWVRTLSGDCSGDKASGKATCSQRTQLLESRDGAMTWTPVGMD